VVYTIQSGHRKVTMMSPATVTVKAYADYVISQRSRNERQDNQHITKLNKQEPANITNTATPNSQSQSQPDQQDNVASNTYVASCVLTLQPIQHGPHRPSSTSENRTRRCQYLKFQDTRSLAIIAEPCFCLTCPISTIADFR